jgi:ribosomal-protein-alanine N-acetyltransferase
MNRRRPFRWSRAVPAELTFPLEGPSVSLRPFALADIPAAHLIYSDPVVMRWVGHGAVRHEAASGSIIRQYIAHQEAHGFAFWAVIERNTGTLIGDAGLARTVGGDIEMGYTLRREWWGRGLGTEAAGLCVAAARGPLGFAAIRALVEPPNAASRHVLEKLGFHEDGVTIAFGREHLVYRLAF